MKIDEKLAHKVEVLVVRIQENMGGYESRKGVDLVNALKLSKPEFDEITAIPMDVATTTRIIDEMVMLGKLASSWQPGISLQIETIYRLYQLMRRKKMETKFFNTLAYLRLIASGIEL